MKLIPLIDRTGAVRVWADRNSSWLFHLTGDAFGLVSFDAVFRRTGAQIGWWYGDHIRDRFGRVVLVQPGTKIEGLDAPRPKKDSATARITVASWPSSVEMAAAADFEGTPVGRL